jgi:hypothetical protein
MVSEIGQTFKGNGKSKFKNPVFGSGEKPGF